MTGNLLCEKNNNKKTPPKSPPKVFAKICIIGTAVCKCFKRTLIRSNWLKQKTGENIKIYSKQVQWNDITPFRKKGEKFRKWMFQYKNPPFGISIFSMAHSS